MSAPARLVTGLAMLGLVAAGVAHATVEFNTPGVFDVSPTGEATYTVPINLPRGAGGLTPQLAFIYGSHRGNGHLGMGLRIAGLSVLHRCGRTLAQDGAVQAVTLTSTDRLCLDGNKLRLTAGTYGAANSTYQTELQTFATIKAFGTTGTGPQYFEVWHKNGLIYEYGNTADSRIEVAGSATIPRLWALNKIRDRDGNYILFNYTEDNANGSYRPADIQYTGNAAQSLLPAYKIQFSYLARSSQDVLVRYESGYKQRDTNVLGLLEVKYNGAVVRSFTPSYATSGSGSTLRTRAETIFECGQGENICNTTMNLYWQSGTNSLEAQWDSGQAIAAGTVVHSIDANADGRSDIVYPSGGTWRVRYGLTTSTYDYEIDTGIAATNPGQSHSIDYSGDGFRDVIYPDGSGNWRVLQFGFSGITEVLTGRPATGAASGLVAVQDMDGDGREDVLSASGAQLRVRLNTATGLSATETTVYTAASGWTFDTNAFGPVGVDEYRRQRTTIDFNGDGRGDLVARLIQTVGGAIQWKALVSMGTTYKADLNLESSSTQRPLLLDVNGDGLIDALGHNGTSWVVNFARGGHDPAVRSIFDSAKAYPSNTTSLTEAIAADYDGDSAADVLVPSGGTWHVAYSTRESFGAVANLTYAAPASHNGRATDVDGDGLIDLSYRAGPTWALRTHSGELPDLVTDLWDAFGNYSAAFYATIPNTNEYSRDAEPTFPVRRFTAPLPIARKYIQSGNAGNWWAPVSYKNANWHAQGRGFLGFSYQSVFDTRSDVRNERTFRQDFPYIGLVSVDTQSRRDPSTYVEKKFAETTNTWATITAGTGFAMRSFPYVSSSNRKRWEVGGDFDQAQVSDATTTALVDTYGTPYDVTKTTTEVASANGVQAGVVYTERTFTPLAQLTNDTTNWCLGQVKQVQDIRSHTAFQGTSQTRTTNQAWDTVKCRVTGQTIQPGHATLQVTKTFGFDGFGNRSSETVTGVGMAARTTATTWGTTGQFPHTVTNPLSQVTTMGYDFAHGVRTSLTDPNGIQTTYVLDARGRVTRENRPDGTAATWQYTDCYVLDDCVSGLNRLVVIEKTLDTGGGTLTEKVTHQDRRGRPLVIKTKLLSGAFNWVEMEYENRGLLTRQSAPCWKMSCTHYWTEHTYDQLGRRVSTSRPTSDSNPALVTTTTHYEGLTTRAVDPLGKETKTIAKVNGEPARLVDHNGYYLANDHDAFMNLVRVQDSLGNTLQTSGFDIRGNRTASTDPDRGSWGYAFNALGEMTSQTDANSKTTTFTYDALSRMTQRVEPEGAGSITSTWTWGAVAHNTVSNKYIGRLKSQSISGTGVTTYTETFTFDALGRPTQTLITEGANSYTTDTSYQAATGYVDTLTYPTSTSSYRLKLQYEYQNGQLQRIKDFNAPTTVFWQANATNARGRTVDESLGNGLGTVSDFDAVTGRMDSIATGPGGTASIQNLAYLWDNAGNLMQRQDNNQGLTENFYYDNVHRLDYSTLGGSTNLDVALDAKGNVTSKSGVGTYTYHATKVHAVASINTGGGTMSFSYDNVGNMTNRNGTTLTWYANNLPKAITKDANNSSIFEYGPSRARWKHIYKTGGTTFTHTYVGELMETVVSGGVTEFKHFIVVQGQSIALYSRKSSGTNAIYYRHDDHLGSTEHLTDGAGSNVVMQSFGAYGQRRGTNWTGTPTPAELATINSTTRKGFTEHEMLDSTELVHMNGRVFDPVTGRFVSADPFEDCALETQGLNRYAYVGNQAVSKVDPTGFYSAWDDWGGGLTNYALEFGWGGFSLMSESYGASLGLSSYGNSLWAERPLPDNEPPPENCIPFVDDNCVGVQSCTPGATCYEGGSYQIEWLTTPLLPTFDPFRTQPERPFVKIRCQHPEDCSNSEEVGDIGACGACCARASQQCKINISFASQCAVACSDQFSETGTRRPRP